MLEFVLIVFGVTYLLAGLRRGLRYLRFFQQQDYLELRYLAWLKEKRAFDTRLSAIFAGFLLLTALSALLGGGCLLFLWVLLAAALSLGVVFLEEDPRSVGKIRLNMTERANRIYQLSMSLLIALILLSSLVWRIVHGASAECVSCGAWNFVDSLFLILLPLLWIHCVPFLIPLANYFLNPIEMSIQREFREDAERILREVNPYVIGITGSYGKTSTKTLLGELMNTCLAPTFWPPKSYNSIMGITRDVRARLNAGHRYAIMEMGAYGIGSIQRLCEFTPPKAAIVTAVGIMHLERFGSPEAVYRAKRELAEAVPQEGILVLNGDNPGSRRMAEDCPKAQTILYGLDNSKADLQCWLEVVSRDDDETDFLLHWRGKSYPSSTKLLGDAALSNIAAAFSMCVALGAQPAFVAASIANLASIDNRLSLRRDGDVRYLQDAFNSNPVGFSAALKTLKDLPAKRRILMTPGMIELGERQELENREIAKSAAGVVDLALIVGLTNRQAIAEGLRAGGLSEEKILIVDTREQAFSKLSELRQPGDLVLIENDLTDLYEMDVRF